MLNLARIKYAKIMSKNGGPISEINIKKKDILFSQTGYEAVSYLKNELIPHNSISSEDIYGIASGTGSDSCELTAIYKSISESLERWAFFQSMHSRSEKYGFTVSPSTDGMAAFPSPLSIYAKRNAKFESLERWSIASWWLGKLPIVNKGIDNGISSYQIIPETNWGKVSLLHYQQDGIHSYGFAASSTYLKAKRRAEIELKRNFDLLKVLNRDLKLINIDKVYEKRLIYFSQEEGYLNFKEKVDKSLNIKTSQKPKVLLSTSIPGPWQDYATVWRYLLDIPQEAYANKSYDFFYF